MVKIAHIIQPVIVDASRDLFFAQPVTVETMRIGKECAQDKVEVALYAIQSHDEARFPLPQCFHRLPDLTRSIGDLKQFSQDKKLPLIKDILDALYQASQAEYFIYTNVDIAVQPYFYQTVAKIIAQGYDAFVINRRTISDRFTSVPQIPLMYAELGEAHKGYDCFIFRRALYPRFELGLICIGTAWIGRTLLANLVTYAAHFREFRNAHLTFHLGDSNVWRKDEFAEYQQHNWREYEQIFKQLEAEHGEFEPLWRSYLLETGDRRQIPEFE